LSTASFFPWSCQSSIIVVGIDYDCKNSTVAARKFLTILGVMQARTDPLELGGTFSIAARRNLHSR